MPGDHLEGDPLSGQRVDLFAPAPEDEGVATLQAQDPMPLFGQIRE